LGQVRARHAGSRRLELEFRTANRSTASQVRGNPIARRIIVEHGRGREDSLVQRGAPAGETVRVIYESSQSTKSGRDEENRFPQVAAVVRTAENRIAISRASFRIEQNRLHHGLEVSAHTGAIVAEHPRDASD